MYRILQESLTNAARHAPGVPARVTLAVEGGSAQLIVDTPDTSPAPGPAEGRGIGLTGMRERAEAVGGSLTAGPHGAGWRVEAVLPA